MVSSEMVTTFTGIFALFISLFTLWLTHLRGIAIALSVEKCEMPELSPDEFKDGIPTTLRGTISLFVLNKGNRTGAIKITKLEFDKAKNFANFFKECEFRIQSTESPSNWFTTPPMTVIIKDGSADLINIAFSLKLNPVIERRYDYNLETIKIESNNLKELLNKLLEYKKERLKEFIDFLRSNEKLGRITMSCEYTRRWPLWGAPFKKKQKSVDVVHPYKENETLKYYNDALKNYQLDPEPTKIIENVISEIDILKSNFNKCYEDLERYRNEELFGFSVAGSIKNRYFDRKNSIIVLLKKCRDYKEIIERDIEPLLEDLLSFQQKTEKADKTPQGKIKQKLIDEIKKEREPLRKNLKKVTSSLENLGKEVERELEEVP
ncbi:MAG: hypothetical protein J7K33_06675 [Candidatus Marinimicrobia bacterium]|nr:hypothetical protein [Candidatus Neomarinimicrobiota bacterium]